MTKPCGKDDGWRQHGPHHDEDVHGQEAGDEHDRQAEEVERVEADQPDIEEVAERQLPFPQTLSVRVSQDRSVVEAT
jgi:hypothetical protein